MTQTKNKVVNRSRLKKYHNFIIIHNGNHTDNVSMLEINKTNNRVQAN